MRRIEPYFPLSHGGPRVDDRRIISGIIFVIRNGLRWRDCQLSTTQEHHRGYIDWHTYEANQQRIARNTRPGPHKAGGAVREGSALLQGLASCGHCGRRLRTHYRGRNSTPGYHCSGEHLVEGRGSYCLNIGGVQIDDAVARAFIAAPWPSHLFGFTFTSTTHAACTNRTRR